MRANPFDPHDALLVIDRDNPSIVVTFDVTFFVSCQLGSNRYDSDHDGYDSPPNLCSTTGYSLRVAEKEWGLRATVAQPELACFWLSKTYFHLRESSV